MNTVLKIIATATIILIAYAMLTSCSRRITPYEAANGKAKCGRWLK
jgi:hypothetical protein